MVGQIRATVTVVVTAPEEGRFILSGAGERLSIVGETEALEAARHRAIAAHWPRRKPTAPTMPCFRLGRARCAGNRGFAQARRGPYYGDGHRPSAHCCRLTKPLRGTAEALSDLSVIYSNEEKIG